MGKDTPALGPPIMWFDGESLYIPDSEFVVWLRDKSGNESNHLPVLRPTREWLQDRSVYEPDEIELHPIRRN